MTQNSDVSAFLDVYNKADALIFDMDGTLILSNHLFTLMDDRFREAHNIAESYFDPCFPHLTFMERAEFVKKRCNLDMEPQDICAEWTKYAVEEYLNSPPQAGVNPFLKRAMIDGKALGISTTASQDLTALVIMKEGWEDVFQCFSTVDEVGKGKPHPHVYQATADKLGIDNKKCIVFEDSISGVKGARNFDPLAIVAVNGFWGQDTVDYVSKEADFYFHNYTPIIVALNELEK